MKGILLLFVSAFLWTATSSIETVRKNYSVANNGKKQAELFINSVISYSGTDATLLAYQAAAYTLKAKHNSILKGKKEEFTKGAKALEDVIRKNPNLAEARMIRMSIQENTPKFMGYNQNIDEDKEKIIELFSKQSAEVKATLRNYVAQSKSFTENEKSKLK